MNRTPDRRPPGSVRIIAGSLRGSKLPVADRPGLRPTPDRVRETLFNWLQPALPGARVLDLFAGTGALGIEAASRGAAEVLMLEHDPALAEGLRAQVRRLGATAVAVRQADALRWLADEPARPFDVVFVDPPFAAGSWEPVTAALGPWLAPSAWVHVEAPRGAAVPWPAGWREHRRGATRDVEHWLFRTGDGPVR